MKGRRSYPILAEIKLNPWDTQAEKRTCGRHDLIALARGRVAISSLSQYFYRKCILFTESSADLIKCMYLCFISFPNIEGEVVLYVVGKLLLVFRIQPQHLNESLCMDTLEIAVRQSSYVAAWFYYDIGGWSSASYSCCCVGKLEVEADVAAHQVTFAWNNTEDNNWRRAIIVVCIL